MKDWRNITVTEIAIAVHVKGGVGQSVHINRPRHGLVMNQTDAAKDYYFSDGTVLHTDAGELFYLPKGSDYRVKAVTLGDCYAINFEANDLPLTKPFTLRFRDSTPLLKSFREATKAWKEQRSFAVPMAKACIYESIALAIQEGERTYLPGATADLLAPGEELLQERYTDAALTVSALAECCGISEAYFRRLFREKHGVNPQEYLSRMRITYATQLLADGQFSVGETGVLCGFSEPCHFSREFHRRMGVSPMQYKKRHSG